MIGVGAGGGVFWYIITGFAAAGGAASVGRFGGGISGGMTFGGVTPGVPAGNADGVDILPLRNCGLKKLNRLSRILCEKVGAGETAETGAAEGAVIIGLISERYSEYVASNPTAWVRLVMIKIGIPFLGDTLPPKLP